VRGKKWMAAVAALAVAAVGGFMVFGQGGASAATAKSTPSHTASWAGSGRVPRPSYVGEQHPTASDFGSLKFVTTATTPQRAYYRPASGKLSDIDQMSYQWFKAPDAADAPAGAAGQVTAYVLWFDVNDAAENVFAAVYEPVYEVNPDGTARYPGNVLPTGAWQTANLFAPSARWYVAQDDPQKYTPFSDIQARFPNATLNLVGLNQGSGNDGVTSYVDHVSLNGDDTDFETDPTPGILSAVLSQPGSTKCGVVTASIKNVRTSANAEPATFEFLISGVVIRREVVPGRTAKTETFGPFGEDSRGGRAVVVVRATDSTGVHQLAGPRTYTTNCQH
jgi:hypothetical protein